MRDETYSVVDPDTDEQVLGPFDDESYAEKAKRRYEGKWPRELEVVENWGVWW